MIWLWCLSQLTTLPSHPHWFLSSPKTCLLSVLGKTKLILPEGWCACFLSGKFFSFLLTPELQGLNADVTSSERPPRPSTLNRSLNYFYQIAQFFPLLPHLSQIFHYYFCLFTYFARYSWCSTNISFRLSSWAQERIALPGFLVVE